MGQRMKLALRSLAFCTLGAALWLAAMESVLRHPGNGERMVIDALIALESAATLALTFFETQTVLRYLVLAGAFGISYVAGTAVYRIVQAPHFEGFVLIMGAGLVVQAALSCGFLLGRRVTPRPVGAS